MRRTVRLVIALCALAAFTAPAAMAAERMWVGFHDDPSFRWVPDRGSRIQAASREGATIMRLLVQWDLAAPTRPSSPANPFDPAYRFDDIDEALRSAQETDMEVMLTISGSPRWANGGRNPQRHPEAHGRLHRVRASDRKPLLGAVQRLSVRAFLLRLERAEPQSLPDAPVQQRRQVRGAGELREALRGGLRGPQGGEPDGEDRDRRDVGARTRSAGAGSLGHPLARKVRRARGEGQSAAQVRRVDASPVPVPPELQAVPGREVAERVARFASPLQRRAEEVVQPQDGTHLGHRVRSPDEAGRKVRRSVLDAGRVHPAVDGDREEVPVRRDVHLVRLPGHEHGTTHSGVGVRPVQGRRRAEGIVAEQVRRQREAARRAKRRLRLPRGHHDAARQPVHAPLLRREPDGRVDRNDVAHLSRITADRRRPADVGAPARLHDQRAPALPVADGQGSDVHGDVRAERPARRQSQPQADASH